MITLAERIAALLKATPGRAVCVGCVARALELPHKRAHQGMLKLEAFSNIHRFFGPCAVCRKTRLVVATSPAMQVVAVPTELSDGGGA